MATLWTLTGRMVITCNCDWGCPCNFNARPTHGRCEGGWTWHVDRGSYGTVALDGLNFSVYAKWPGAIHEGNGEALILIDERADGPQRKAIEELLDGKIGEGSRNAIRAFQNRAGLTQDGHPSKEVLNTLRRR